MINISINQQPTIKNRALWLATKAPAIYGIVGFIRSARYIVAVLRSTVIQETSN